MPSVLVLDRDAARRATAVAWLRAAGQEPLVAEDAAAVVAALAEPGVGLLLLDLTVPELDLPTLRQALAPAAFAEPDSLDAAERRHIARVLRHTGGNKRRAALLLGISRSTLLNKIRRYHLDATGALPAVEAP